MAETEALLADLTSEMRWALDRLRTAPQYLGGSGPGAIPKGTGEALRRRGLVEKTDGSRIRLTDLGRDTAIARLRARLRAEKPDPGYVRVEAILDGPPDTIYGPRCLDHDLGVRREGHRLIDYTVISRRAVRVIVDVPAATGLTPATRASLTGDKP